MSGLCGTGNVRIDSLPGFVDQVTHDKYSSKSEACEDGTYRKSDGYKKFGQIGWEKESGWRQIQYLDRYEREHRIYNTNSFLYCHFLYLT